MNSTVTSNVDKATYLSPANWRGRKVLLSSEHDILRCLHVVEEMTNYGSPTGVIWCPKCGGVQDQADAREA